MTWNGNQSEFSDGGVAVVDEPDSIDAGIFTSLLDAYQGQGYELGYRRGVADVLASMLALTEDYVREQGAPDPRVRQALYKFEAYVEARLVPRQERHEFVSDGLGI